MRVKYSNRNVPLDSEPSYCSVADFRASAKSPKRDLRCMATHLKNYSRSTKSKEKSQEHGNRPKFTTPDQQRAKRKLRSMATALLHKYLKP